MWHPCAILVASKSKECGILVPARAYVRMHGTEETVAPCASCCTATCNRGPWSPLLCMEAHAQAAETVACLPTGKGASAGVFAA
eukprot:1146041-Pelagomonas_calceolata.AAC.1